MVEGGGSGGSEDGCSTGLSRKLIKTVQTSSHKLKNGSGSRGNDRRNYESANGTRPNKRFPAFFHSISKVGLKISKILLKTMEARTFIGFYKNQKIKDSLQSFPDEDLDKHQPEQTRDFCTANQLEINHALVVRKKHKP